MKASTSCSASSIRAPSLGKRSRSWSATVRQGAAHEVHAAALPGGLQHLGDRGLDGLVAVADDEGKLRYTRVGSQLEVLSTEV